MTVRGVLKRIRPVAIVRLIAAVSLLAVGAVHIQQYAVENYSTVPTIGPLFLVNFIGGTALGLYFLIPAGPRAGRWRLLIDMGAAVTGWMVAGGALVGLLISEHTPLFGFMESNYRPAIILALASEAAAALSLAILFAFIVKARHSASAPARASVIDRHQPSAGTT